MKENLTERKKADRAKMAEMVRELAVNCGAEVEIISNWLGESRAVAVKIAASRGVGLTVDFDGTSTQPGVFVLSWHIDDSDARFADFFCGCLNTCHFAKATDVCHGFDSLLEILRERLESIREGWAFSPEREAEQIAKHGTAAQRRAKWDRYRQEEVEARKAAV